MKVAIDTTCRYVTKAGTTRYTNGLLRGLKSLNRDISITEIVWPVDNLTYEQPARSLKTLYRELIWAHFIAPAKLRKLKPDVLHMPAGAMISPPPGLPWVPTLLDLAILRHPERFRLWQRHTGPLRLQRTCKANLIITISQFTADEAMKLMNVPASRLRPVLLGCDFQSDSPEVQPQFPIPSEYFLFVGSLEPGKNLALLREVYLFAEQEGAPLPPLVVVGVRWAGVAHEGDWPRSWISAGRISDEELVYLYRRALALVFPSKYEGFGFPVVEAMTLNCPVVCSRMGSIPEVGGDAALYVDLTVEAYFHALVRLTKENDLRSTLIARGASQARKFSWTKCAEDTARVYDEVAGV